MKIEAIGVTRQAEPKPVILDAAYNLAEYGYFARGGAKEFLTFAIRTLAHRLGAGQHCVDYEGKLIYAFISADSLGAIAVCDKEYPARVIMTLLKDLTGAMRTEHPADWRTAAADGGCKLAKLEATLVEYQDPTKVDRIMKLDRSLDETKAILHRTIEAVLERGEKLDDLVDKSEELSRSSKAFYKEARKTNSCCLIV